MKAGIICGSGITTDPEVIFVMHLQHQEKNVHIKMANENAVGIFFSPDNACRFTSLTAVGRSSGTGTVMVDTQGWRRALPPVCLLPHRWVTLHQRAGIFQMSSWCYEMWIHLPRSEISELLFLLMTHSAFYLTTAKYCLFPFRYFLRVPVPCDASNLLAALPETRPWGAADIEIVGDTSCRMMRNLLGNCLLGNCFHILAHPSRQYKTLLPWSLPTNGSWTLQLICRWTG